MKHHFGEHMKQLTLQEMREMFHQDMDTLNVPKELMNIDPVEMGGGIVSKLTEKTLENTVAEEPEQNGNTKVVVEAMEDVATEDEHNEETCLVGNIVDKCENDDQCEELHCDWNTPDAATMVVEEVALDASGCAHESLVGIRKIVIPDTSLRSVMMR